MTRTITLEKKYSGNSGEIKNRRVKVQGYFHERDNSSQVERLPLNIKRVLPPELDIFSELPAYVYKNEDARIFLEELRKHLLSYKREELDGIYLSKLRVTESNDITLVIEWIFNYFRLYFSFDRDEGNYYGEVHTDNEKGSFHNAFNRMERDDYPKIAEAEMDYAVMMAGGGN